MKRHFFFYSLIVVICLGIVAFTSYESLMQISKLKLENAQLENTMETYTDKISSYKRSSANQEEKLTVKEQQIKDLKASIDAVTNNSSSSSSETEAAVPETKTSSQTTSAANAVYDTITEQNPSLYSIAKKNGTTVDELMKLNNMTADSVYQIGDKIRVK